jgi:hypothetical protein
VKRVLFWIWPPYEAYVTHAAIDRNLRETGEKARFAEIVASMAKMITPDVALDKLEEHVQNVQESELKRNTTIEDKAASLTGSISITMAIVSILPALFSTAWGIPKWVATVAGTAYLFAIIHLFVGVYYAIKVRKVEGYEMPCVERVVELVRDAKWRENDRAILMLSQTRWNEPILTKKANLLMVAEALCLRGLALIAFGAVFAVCSKLITVQVP